MEKEDVEKQILKRLDKSPKSLIPYTTLKSLGLSRYKCKVCGKNFWSLIKRENCGNVDCVGDYTFFDKRVTSKKMNYRELWTAFSRMFKKFGHKEIKRYPVVARWRDDIYFVEAAIDDFAPYVINGLVDAPANPLVVPQICLRFNDTNNVGLSGRHLTSFIMAEQATFNTKKKKTYFDKEAIRYIFKWLTEGLKAYPDELTFIEDAWVGAGYAGNSLEFFLGGVEIGNQVYMRYSIDEDGLKDLQTKTIDMGAGLDRWAWISQGTPTVYEAVFPKVVSFIKNKVGVNYDNGTLKRIYKFLGKNDFEKVALNDALLKLSEESGMPVDELKRILSDMQAVYAIADHTRTLLVSIHDGALPSNVGGGYNLRNLLRRCLAMIEKKEWNLDLNEVINQHKMEFGSWFKELNDFEISSVINKEIDRYKEFKQRNAKLIDSLVEKGEVGSEEMRELYESKGVTIDDIRSVAEAINKTVKLPEKFYTAINKKERHFHRGNLDTTNLKETAKLFYDEKLLNTRARIIKKIDDKHIILDKTIFYPEMGGQKADGGEIDGIKVTDVRIENNIIVHSLENAIKKSAGSSVNLIVDRYRRELLRKHHTATHIINQASRRILGEFVYQNGAEKDVDKAHLDITYFDKLSDNQVNDIEALANEIVSKDLELSVKIMDRTEAESKYGMSIYQGGAIPSASLRVVTIDGYDVEACGGLHCHRSGEVGLIKIVKSERIQDGIVRLTFKAYKPALEYIEELNGIVRELMDMWGVSQNEVSKTASRFFSDAKRYKDAYESAETTRIAYELLENKPVKTKLNNLGMLIKAMSAAKTSVKTGIIESDSIGIGFPKNEEVRKTLSKKYKSLTDKDWFILGHN